MYLIHRHSRQPVEKGGPDDVSLSLSLITAILWYSWSSLISLVSPVNEDEAIFPSPWPGWNISHEPGSCYRRLALYCPTAVNRVCLRLCVCRKFVSLAPPVRPSVRPHFYFFLLPPRLFWKKKNHYKKVCHSECSWHWKWSCRLLRGDFFVVVVDMTWFAFVHHFVIIHDDSDAERDTFPHWWSIDFGNR